ncbi:MAG: GerMN domain-containing protein [Mobilitalea sp.]
MRKQIIVIFILLMMISLGACNNNKDNASDDKSVVDIYCIDTKTTGIVSEKYEVIGSEKVQQVNELLYMLKKSPENMLYKSALPENATVKEAYFNDDGSLTINFEPTYTQLSGIPEVLCRATIVKTLSQISGVELIQFNINGELLKDSNGEYVGLMTEEDFIDSTGSDTNVKLYFANEDGTALIEYISDINYTGVGTIEELVIQQLINGPTEIGMQNTIPEGTTLLNVNTKEGICYVDFNEKFLDKVLDISDEVAIYSIVNSLVELPNINKVQFTINSEVQKIYREGTVFDGSFERNLKLIEGIN